MSAAREQRENSAPPIELSGIAVITEYRRHALGAADVADGGGVSSYVIQRVLHRQLRVGFQNLRLGAAVIAHEIRSDEFVVESLESTAKQPARLHSHRDTRGIRWISRRK